MRTNNLRFSTSKKINYEGKPSTIYVDIRLNDECKNGYQDFAITGEIYGNQKGGRGDRSFITGGCIHDEILKYFPEFAPFVNLHLCDYSGIPMYAVENGYYHLTNGLSKLGAGETQKTEYCKYYRLTAEQYDRLLKSENKTEFAILLKDLGVLEQWKKEADKAIEILENLTGSKFLIDSKRTQYNAPEAEKVEEFKRLKAEGYYSDEAKAERARAEAEENKKASILKITEDFNKEVEKHRKEYDLKMELLRIGYPINPKTGNIKAGIYYNHTNTLQFNWSTEKIGYDEALKVCYEIDKKKFKGLKIKLDKELLLEI